MTVPGWDEAYAASTPAPRDIGRPQPAFVRLAEQGLLSGPVSLSAHLLAHQYSDHGFLRG
jgi:hypothetical protein